MTLSGCAQPATFDEMVDGLIDRSVELVQPTELSDDVIFLDAREKNEFNVSRIAGAIWVGYDTFRMSRVKDLPKDSKVVVYCSVGPILDNS